MHWAYHSWSPMNDAQIIWDLPDEPDGNYRHILDGHDVDDRRSRRSSPRFGQRPERQPQ